VEIVPGGAVYGVTPAGFWIRVGALLLDSIVLMILGAIAWPILFGESYWKTTNGNEGDFTGFSFVVAGGDDFFASVYYGIYFTLLVWRFGATLGKRALSIKIVDANGDKPSLPRAFVRHMASYLSAFILLIGRTESR
jgi:uncharacterized RDD family membrane protein YckC